MDCSPPQKLVPIMLNHARDNHAQGILVIPKWKSAAYWPLLRTGNNWADGISCEMEYARPKQFFTRAPVGNNLFSENTFLSNVLVLKIKF
jgi:hypothetical protein